MKVFLSWSGDLSHQVACAFRDWLPCVVQSVKPYVSSEDIDKGARWSTDIAQELQESTYGILCITKDNIDAPWINFEAGALSKTIDKSFVSPFLFNVKRSEVQGPLLQFQSTVHEKDDIFKLLVSVNNRLDAKDRLEASSLKRAFEVWWPELESQLLKFDQKENGQKGHNQKEDRKHQDAILEEILELTRTQQKLLRDPERLLPAGYLDMVLSRRLSPETDHEVSIFFDKAHNELVNLKTFIASAAIEDSLKSDLVERISRLHQRFHMLTDISRMRRRIRRLESTSSIVKPEA